MLDGVRELLFDPRVVLALLVGAFHTSAYLFIRGRAGWHFVAILPAACAGAFAGQVLSARLGDLLWIGPFGLIWASLSAWAGIGLVVLARAVRPGAGRGDTEGAGDIRPRGQRS